MAAVAVLACYSGTRRQKASRFGGMASDDGVRAWFNLRVPKTRWPALLKIRSLCSAVAKGKGDDLIRFLDDAHMPKNKWPSILRSGGLCSAVITGKGDDLIRFLSDTEMPKDI